jgi:hypothetical protein
VPIARTTPHSVMQLAVPVGYVSTSMTALAFCLVSDVPPPALKTARAVSASSWVFGKQAERRDKCSNVCTMRPWRVTT